jgi:flagellar motor switch protein FliM
MAKILSQDEIDALLASVESGEETPVEVRAKQKKISVYDFKRPNLISKEQMRLLENIHEGLARNFGVFLSAQLRMIVDINLLAIDQIMYSEFMMSIATPGAIYMGKFDDPYSQFILELSPQLGIFIVERLFGGPGKFTSTIRPISVIEQRVLRRVVERIASEISKNWDPIKAFKCTFTRFESNPEFVQIVPASEPVVVVSMEIKIYGTASMMNICYPYMWISNIMSSPEIQEKILFGTHEATQQERDLIESNLRLTQVDLRAVLGDTTISIGDFINLNVGDVIRLGTRIDHLIPVYSENRKLFQAVIGKQSKNYAFRIQSLITDEDHDGL